MPELLTDALKRAIRESGLTHYRISQLSGVSSPILDRFMSGQRDNITISTAAKIADALGLQWVTPKRKKTSKNLS